MRLVAFITLVFLLPVLPWGVMLGLFALYTGWFEGYELLGLGLAADVYFGHSALYPLYTIAALSVVVLAIWAKPRLLFYTR